MPATRTTPRASADAAFRRYFEKRVAGVPTNGAAVSRLENEANYRSAVLFQKQGDVYRLGYDPWDIDDDDGVPRSPLGYD